MAERYDELLLLGFLEGDLDAADRARVEQLLAGDARLRSLMAQLRQDRALLRGIEPQPAPPHVLEAVHERLERQMLLDEPGPHVAGTIGKGGRRMRRALSVAGVAAVVLLAASLIGPMLLNLHVFWPRGEEDVPSLAMESRQTMREIDGLDVHVDRSAGPKEVPDRLSGNEARRSPAAARADAAPRRTVPPPTAIGEAVMTPGAPSVLATGADDEEAPALALRRGAGARAVAAPTAGAPTDGGVLAGRSITTAARAAEPKTEAGLPGGVRNMGQPPAAAPAPVSAGPSGSAGGEQAASIVEADGLSTAASGSPAERALADAAAPATTEAMHRDVKSALQAADARAASQSSLFQAAAWRLVVLTSDTPGFADRLHAYAREHRISIVDDEPPASEATTRARGRGHKPADAGSTIVPHPESRLLIRVPSSRVADLMAHVQAPPEHRAWLLPAGAPVPALRPAQHRFDAPKDATHGLTVHGGALGEAFEARLPQADATMDAFAAKRLQPDATLDILVLIRDQPPDAQAPPTAPKPADEPAADESNDKAP